MKLVFLEFEMSIQMSQFLRRFSFALVVVAGTAMTVPAIAQDGAAAPAATEGASEGKALFEKAAKAISDAQAITFNAKLTPEGTTLTKAYAAAETAVKALRKPESSFGWLIRVSGSETESGRQLDVAWQPSSIEGVDHAKKSVLERAGAQTPVPGLRTGQTMRLPKIFAAQPYKGALAATEFTMEGEKTIGGEVCDVVVVNEASTSQKFRYAIARKDSFPRMVEQLFESATMQGKVTIEITNVAIDNNTPPALNENELRVPVPEGYTEDRQAGTPTVRPVPGKQPSPPGIVETPATPEKTQPAPAVTPAPAPKGPTAAADFELSTPTGEKVTLASLKGKVVVMQFWGSWCLPCREWHKTLADGVTSAASEKVSDVELLALAVRERDNQNAVSELASRDARFKLLVGADEVAKTYGANVFPTTIVVDKDGIIAATVTDTDSSAVDSVKNAVRVALGLSSDASKSEAKTEEVAAK